MNYQGLVEFLMELCDGDGLDEFDLERVKSIGHDNDGNERFSVTIRYKRLLLRVDSYIPPLMVRREIKRLAREILPDADE